MKIRFLELWTLLLLSVGILPAPAPAQNSVLFPYVVNDQQTATDLVFTNATGSEATVRLTGYQEGGAAIIPTAGSILIPANAQVVVGAAAFGDFSGWVLAESNIVGVVGNLKVGSPDGTAVDIAAPAQAAAEVALPLVAQGQGGKSTEISLVNPSQNHIRIRASLYNMDGSLNTSVVTTVQPRGMLRGSLGSVFPAGTNFDNASHVVAKAEPQNIFSPTANITGFEVIRGFYAIPQDPSRQKILARTDIAALAAVPTTSGGTSLTFPHVIRGTALNWFSYVGLVNLSASSQSPTFVYSYQDSNGNPITLTRSDLTVPVNGSLRLTVTDLFPVPVNAGDHGYLTVTSSDNLLGFLGLGTIAGSSFTTSPVQTAGQTQFLFPSLDEAGSSFTGIALLNTNSSPVDVRLYLMSEEGINIGRLKNSKITLSPNGGRAVFSLEDGNYFPEGVNQTGGYIFVDATAPVFAIGYLGVPDKTMSALFPEPIASFNLSPQLLFTLRGAVTFTTGTESAPVAGVPINLSKGANLISQTSTNSNGEYFFTNLVSGVYTVTPSLSGKIFDPQSRTVTLAIRSESDVNFSVLDPQVPVVTLVTPSETTAQYEVSSPGLTIEIDGFGFGPDTKVLFDDKTTINGVEIITRYSSPTDLTAFLPAQALRSGGIYSIKAKNGDSVSGEAVNFTIKNLVPQITSLDPPGPAAILGPGPGPVHLDLVINGSNFHPPGLKDPGTVIAIAVTPDVFPAINPLIGSTPQCTLVGTRFPFPLGVQALDVAGNPAAGVAVTFTVPGVLTTEPSGFFPGGGSVTVVTDSDGIATTILTANPFAGSYSALATATIDGFPLSALFFLTNLNPGDTCNAFSSITYVSSQQIIVSIPIAQTGSYTVQAINAAPGGGSSDLVSFDVTEGPPQPQVPVITAIDPNSVIAGSSNFTLNVFGVNFENGAAINFGTSRLSTTFVSANQLRATVAAGLVSAPGVVPVSVTNPGTGGTSRRVQFTVNPAP